MSLDNKDILSWGNSDENAETIVRDFCLDVAKIFSTHLPSDIGAQLCNIDNDLGTSKDAGYLTSKVVSLIETLLDY
ncbi:unnamed protein product, partial [Cuscuta epithymum]